MFNGNGGYSLADIAAATDNNNDGFGGNGAWWIIILFLFCFAGWGNGGYGFGGGGNQGAADNYVLASDFATIQRQLSDGFGAIERKGDTINAGLCDGFYAQNTTLLNGFSNVQAGLTQNQIADMQNTNAITAQLSDIKSQMASCCCDLNYKLAEQSCQTRQVVADSATAIIANQDANTRAILDFMTQDKIASLTAENASLKAAADNAAQTCAIVSQLRPSPVPAYQVPNPYCNCGYNGCGC